MQFFSSLNSVWPLDNHADKAGFAYGFQYGFAYGFTYGFAYGFACGFAYGFACGFDFADIFELC